MDRKADDIFDVIRPYYYLCKLFGCANFTIDDGGKCQVKLIDKVLQVLSTSLYTYITCWFIAQHLNIAIHRSILSIVGKCLILLASWSVTQTGAVIVYVVRKKMAKLFYMVKEVDERLSNFCVYVDFRKHLKFSMYYILSAVTIEASIAISYYIYSKMLLEEYVAFFVVLFGFFQLSFTIFIGQFTLTLLVVKSRFALINKLLR